MLTAIDHLIIAVPDLEAAVKSYQGLGFAVMPGGRHTGIGTYNAQFLPGLFSRAGSPCKIGPEVNDDIHRPPLIAERVIASNYDIIAFNEESIRMRWLAYRDAPSRRRFHGIVYEFYVFFMHEERNFQLILWN
ncbi:MAG: VOC family protein [candidate division NC10 bacterium]